MWSQPLSQSSGTGLSQGVQQIALSGTGLSHGVRTLGLDAALSAQSTVDLSTAALCQFIEAEIVNHFELVQAANHVTGDAAAVAEE